MSGERPVSAGASAGLLERDEELRALRVAFGRAAAGAGRTVVVRGAAGIGKTRLLEAAVSIAGEHGFLALTAQGTPLEREFAFGVARQLLEPGPAALDAAAREEAMTGAGALAAPVVDPNATNAAAHGGDATFAAIHGLYWTIANLADRHPLLLSIDDVHWADTASVRWLVYLARRLGGLAVVIACAVRRGDPATDRDPLQTLLSSPDARIVDVRPLTPRATGALVRARLGDSAGEDLCHACHEVSGGNPLLLGLILDAVPRTTAVPSAERVHEVGAAAVAPYVVDRLATLPDTCRKIAQAAAILGAGASLPDAAAVAGVDAAAAAAAADSLVRAELFEPGRRLTFVHPLLRDAVEAELLEHRRAALHRRAANVLERSGATAERVAAHLLAAPPEGDSGASATLVAAAQTARARGDTEVAVRFLRGALSEAASFPDRPRAVLMLGLLEAVLMDPAAEARLREALAVCAAPDERAAAAKTLGTTLMLARRGDEATALLERVHAELDPVDREAALTVLVALAHLGVYVISTRRRVLPHLRRLRSMQLAGATRAERSALGILAKQAATDGEPVEVVADLARRALEAPTEGVRADDPSVQSALLALWAAGEHREVDERVAPTFDDAQRRGSPWGMQNAWGMHALVRLELGRLHDAEAYADAALRIGREHDYTNREPILLSILVPALLEQGRVDEADAELAAARLPANWEEGWPALRLHLATSRLRRAQRREAEAAAGLRACAALAHRWMLRGVFNTPWRSELALIERGVDSLRLAEEEVQLARSAGAPGPIGVALRARALLAEGEEQISSLREATAVLEGSQAVLEYARTLVELGAALRRANRRSEARGPLRTGIDLAHRCGAAAVVERGQTEIRATGARPRRLLLSGVDALTASERRIADLAAGGMTNRDIAQALFVTAKTIETHLSHIYAKLGIASRRELPEALAGGSTSTTPATPTTPDERVQASSAQVERT